MKLIYLTLSLQLLIGVRCGRVVDSRTEIATSLSDTDFNEEHDFIVIGNGVSGSIVAKRLSENFNWSILVLEAGDDPSLQSDDARKGSAGFDWNYPKEDPLYFLNGHINKVVPYLPSKLIGRAKVAWNWDYLTKYFQGNDHTQEPDLLNPYGYRTKNAVTESKYKSFIQDAYKQRGIKYVTDKNAAEFIGLSSIARNTLRDETSGIKSKNPKSNLRIIYNAFATSVDLNSKGYVEAVNYIRNNHRSTFLKAKARKEYIISAGAYLTPKILMLSGLGPVDHLKEVGIKPNCNLKVGQNLQDHAVIPYFMKVACTDLEPDRQSSQNSRTHYLDFVALTTSSSRAKTYPNIMNTCRLVECKDFNTMNSLLEDLPDEIKKHVLRETKNHHVMVVGIHNIRPKSKGEIKLHSKDPFDAPVVENNLFKSPRDIEAMIAGIRQQQNLLKSEAFQGYSEVTPYLEKCSKMKKDSDAFWECYIRAVGLPFEDAIGTVKMGTEFDPNAVVDACFQVFTTYNLRVIDASVVPSISSGPTYLQAVKVGEKGAELIIKDHS